MGAFFLSPTSSRFLLTVSPSIQYHGDNPEDEYAQPGCQQQ